MAKTLSMPVNCNQKKDPNDTWIYNSGCAVCNGVDIASYFDGTNYTIEDFRNLYNQSTGYSWGTPDGYSLVQEGAAQLSEADTIKRIKAYIDDNQPVACHAVGSGSKEHWMVAYKYTDGTTWADIFVLDPAGTRGASSGALRTMQAGMNYSSVGLGVDKFRVKTLLD